MPYFILISYNSGCYGGEPSVYEHIFKQFLANLDCCDEIYFIIGNSLTAGCREWANRRQKEHSKAKELFDLIENGGNPNSLGKYGRNGIRTFFDTFRPPWLSHQIAEIAAQFKNVYVYQSECDKDYAIMTLAYLLKCPIISSDSDFLLFAVSPIIR